MLDPSGDFTEIQNDFRKFSEFASFRKHLGWMQSASSTVARSRHTFLAEANRHEDWGAVHTDRIVECLQHVQEKLTMSAVAIQSEEAIRIPVAPKHPGKFFGAEFWRRFEHDLRRYDEQLEQCSLPADYERFERQQQMSVGQFQDFATLIRARRRELEAWQQDARRFQIEATQTAVFLEKALRTPIANISTEFFMGDKLGNTQNVHYGSGNTFKGNAVVADRIENSLNSVRQVAEDDPRRAVLEELIQRIGELEKRLEGIDTPELQLLAEDVSNLSQEVARPVASRGILSATLERIASTAQSIGVVAKPVVEAVAKLTPLIKHYL